MTTRGLPVEVITDLLPDDGEDFYDGTLDCGHLAMEGCVCYLEDQYWSGTGESMADDSYIAYLNSSY